MFSMHNSNNPSGAPHRWHMQLPNKEVHHQGNSMEKWHIWALYCFYSGKYHVYSHVHALNFSYPKSSSMDLKKNLKFGRLSAFLKSPKVTRSAGIGSFMRYGVSSSSIWYIIFVSFESSITEVQSLNKTPEKVYFDSTKWRPNFAAAVKMRLGGKSKFGIRMRNNYFENLF